MAGVVVKAACRVNLPGGVVPAVIRIRISHKNHVPQRVPHDASQALSQISNALPICTVNVSPK
jgi:hypothetical protein